MNRVREIVEEIVVFFGAYGKSAKDRIDALLRELSALDALTAKRIAAILRLWSSPDLGRPLNCGALPDGLPASDALCIVVLGYQLNPDGSMKDELKARLAIALEGANRYPEASLLCAGGGTAKDDRSATEAGEMAKWLAARGVSRERILTEDLSLTTAQNAKNACELLISRRPSVESLALVTSDYHMATAELLFGAAAIFRADAPENEKPKVVCRAAVKTRFEPLPAFFQAGALLEVYGSAKAAYDIYYDRYDLNRLPPI